MPASSPRLALAALAAAGLAAVMVAPAAGCDGEGPMPAPNNELLTQVIEQGYRDWARAPGRDERTASTSPHGAAVDIFVNEVVAEGLANVAGLGLTAWPNGATIVLSGHVDLTSREPLQLAIMQKRNGAWYWEQYQADEPEQPRFAGRPDVCLGCHINANDFVRSFPLPAAAAKE